MTAEPSKSAASLAATHSAVVLADVAFILGLGKSVFEEALGDTMRDQPGVGAGLVAWLAIVAGVLYFVGVCSQSLVQVGGEGALLGFVIYATYEFTNVSILQRWHLDMALLDAAWGALACSLTALVSHCGLSQGQILINCRY
jgi:uncharacterized membrane protein